MKLTYYFIHYVAKKRPELSEAWLRRAIIEPIKREIQPDGRIRHWIYITEEQKYLRVITLADSETVHNAFFDRNFKEKTL